MRPRKPWIRKGRGWFIEFAGRQVCLANGDKNPETRAIADAHSIK